MAPYITQNCFNYTAIGVSFPFIVYFLFLNRILRIIISYFVVYEDLYSVFLSSDTLDLLFEFCFNPSFIIWILSIGVLYFLFIFLTFSWMPLDISSSIDFFFYVPLFFMELFLLLFFKLLYVL